MLKFSNNLMEARVYRMVLVIALSSFISMASAVASPSVSNIICELEGIVAPPFPEAYLKIQPEAPIITLVADFGKYRDNYVDQNKASRMRVDWKACSVQKSYSENAFTLAYDCPLNESGLNKTTGSMRINLQDGIGSYRWDLFDTSSGAVSTTLLSFKNCRAETVH